MGLTFWWWRRRYPPRCGNWQQSKLARSRASEREDSLAPALLACWVMMVGHGLMEIDFSIRSFQCMAWLLLLLPVILYARPLPEKAGRWAGLAAGVFIWAYLLISTGLLESHRAVDWDAAAFSTSDPRELMETLEEYIRRDPLDADSYRLSYVANAVRLGDSRYNGNMRKYAETLRRSGLFDNCSGLARYYYLPRGELEETFACYREGVMQESSTKEAWNYAFDFYRTEIFPAIGAEDADLFLRCALSTKAALDEFSQGRLEEIALTEENQAFLRSLTQAEEAGLSGEALYSWLTVAQGMGG